MDMERVQYWLSQGAQPTDRIARMLESAGVVAKKVRNNPKSAVPGKRMAERLAEIVINFQTIPHSIFGRQSMTPNRLVIRLQPDESVRLYLMAKQPGDRVNTGAINGEGRLLLQRLGNRKPNKK